MKNLIFTLCAAFMAIASTACDKDESAPTPASLNGTTWEGKQTTDGQELVRTLTFTQTTAVLKISIAGTTISEFTYAYEYDKPLLTLTATFDGGINLTGAADGNKLTIKNTHAGETYVLIKK